MTKFARINRHKEVRKMERDKLKEILCNQIALIAEVSKNCEPKELADLSDSMANLFRAVLQEAFC